MGQFEQLTAKGFKLYLPNPKRRRWIYEVTAKDLKDVPTACFESRWGTIQPLKLGDYLAMPEEGGEIYLMPKSVFTWHCDSNGHLDESPSRRLPTEGFGIQSTGG